MKLFNISAVALFLLHLGAGAQPQTMDGQSASVKTGVTEQRSAYRVEGYGRMRFGMGADQVRTLLALDFPQVSPAMIDQTDVFTRTRTLTLEVPSLAPGPGAATISCVFGANSHRLIAVNVIWRVAGKTSKEQQAQLINAAAKLAGNFAQHQWPMLRATYGKVMAPGVSAVFAGRDAAGGGVEVWLQGVQLAIAPPLDNTSAPKPADQDLPPGPASLRLTLVANADNPDIYRIPAGAF